MHYNSFIRRRVSHFLILILLSLNCCLVIFASCQHYPNLVCYNMSQNKVKEFVDKYSLTAGFLAVLWPFPYFLFLKLVVFGAFKVSLRPNLIICNLKHNAKNKNFKEMPWTKAQKVEFFCDYTKLAIKAYVGRAK